MPPRLTPTLTIRMVFYGHGPLRNDSSGVRGTWCRATDARYTEGEVPGKERLMGDVSRFAGQHGLRAAGWRHARIFIMYGGSPGLIIASGVGPVVNETVVSVLDVHNTLPAPLGSGSGSGSRGGAAAVDVSQGELEAALRGAMRGNLVVYLAVCMDEEQVLPRDDGFLQQQLQQRAAIEDGTDDPRNRAPEPQPGPEPEPEEQEEEDDAMPERPADADAAPEDLLTEPQQQTAEATIEAEQVDPVSQ
ncbi:hypothetical protein QQS21_001096 [Conoideocrella luteorostrata]|uniref:Uncharacterized protein n=1 Tax=Conoideocrella luteorostrata TaxID=1105319 RepID=A0AAJ0CXI9_9HYPO|nr:hypothetical protein QQS21_001096 [Conoideocrella luteorostrata]